MSENRIVNSQIEILAQELDALLNSKEYVTALELLEEAWPLFRNHLDARTSCVAARVLIRTGHYEFANRLMEEQVLLNPRNPEVIRWWVQSIADTRKDNQIAIRGEVAVSTPVHVSTVEHAAESQIRLGNHHRAREILGRNRKRLQIRGHRLRMHDAFYNLKSPNDVDQVLKETPESISKRSEFASHWALALNELGQYEEAKQLLQPLVDKECINAIITLFEIQRLNGDINAAFSSANLAFQSHGFEPLSKSWLDNGFKLTELRCDPLPISDDNRLVTVLMTAHKKNPMMPTAVRCVLEQTHHNLELLIIDDASSKEDAEYYEEFARSDSRVRIVHQKKNSGTYAGRNRGIEEAKGVFVTFIDSDDWMHPQKIEKALDRLDENEDLVATVESYIRLSPEGNVATVGSWFARKALMTITWRTQNLRDDLGGFDEVRVSADSELLERAEIYFGKNRIQHVPLWTYVATHHDDSLTGGGPFAIGWKGIHGARAEYVAQFRAWHSRKHSNPKNLKIGRGAERGCFPVPESMPRASAGLDFSDDSRNHIPNIVSDITEIELNPFELHSEEGYELPESITVCMATYPPRFDAISKTVESLLDQTLPATRILIHVNESDTPPPLPDDPRIEVHCSPDENLTDIGKFKMASLVESGIVVTVDDDLFYPPDYIENITRAVSRYSGKAIVGYHGAVFPIGSPVQTWDEYCSERRVHWYRRGLQFDLPVQIVGTGTMAYDVNHITFDWKSFDHMKMVDLHIAVAAQKSGYPLVTPNRIDEWMYPLSDDDDEDAIWHIVQDNTELQNQMLDVINRVSDWKLNLTNGESFGISDLRLAKEVRTDIQNDEEVEQGIPYDISKRWRHSGNRLFFDTNGGEIYFDMPDDWAFNSTHEDLFRVAHYVMMSPWEKDILDDWVPSRKPGWRPGLAFSGGMDSVAAMLLMPQDTVLIYNRRHGFETILNHTNAEHLFNHLELEHGRAVVQIPSNHESIRTQYGLSAGFSTDYACAVQVILMADYFGLDSIGTGMPLENSFLFHGHKYRDFQTSWFWRHYSDIFTKIGLDIFQPVAGCSEIINMRIVEFNDLENHAQSCLRSKTPGTPCGACWKCFRKNTLLGHPLTMSNEIVTFLGKRPLKQAASTIYSIQQNNKILEQIYSNHQIPGIDDLLVKCFDYLENHYTPALSLIPLRYRRFTRTRLERYSQPMTHQMVEQLQSMDLFPDDEIKA